MTDRASEMKEVSKLKKGKKKMRRGICAITATNLIMLLSTSKSWSFSQLNSLAPAAVVVNKTVTI